MDEDLRAAAAQAKLDAGIFNPDAAPAEQRFKALVFDATGIDSSDRLERGVGVLPPRDPPGAPSGRVIVLGTPPADAADAGGSDRPARARGTGPRDRQGGQARRDRPAGLRPAQGREPARLDAALLPLAQVGVRLRPGGARRPARRARRQGRLGRSASRQGRARHRRGPGDRCRHRRGAGPRRGPRGRTRRRADGRRAVGGDRPDRRVIPGRRHHRRRRPGDDRLAPARRPRRRRRRRPQRRDHPGQDDGPDEPRTSGAR